MNYQYLLNHGPDSTNAALREMDLKVLKHLEREAQPLIPLGKGRLVA